MHGCGSAKVRNILRLEGQASRLLADYAGALADVSPGKHRAQQILHRARAIKLMLNPAERFELRNMRSGV